MIFPKIVISKYGFVLHRNKLISIADLPDPSGLLPLSITNTVIKVANTVVRDVLIGKEAPDAKRGRYMLYDKERDGIAKRAIDFGIINTP